MAENALGDAFQIIGGLWRHRKGNEIPAAVMDTIDHLYTDLQPLIVKRIKQETGWTFIIHLPAGLSYRDFRSKEHIFQDATHGAVLIEKQGKAVVMRIMTEELKKEYPFKWDHEKYRKMYLPVHFGYSAAGEIVADLAEIINLIIAGHPKAGKSNFLHTLAVELLMSRNVLLTVIDLKMAEFAYLENHALVMIDLAPALMLLRAINGEITKRLHILREAEVVKIQDYEGDMPFIVLIIDELAEMQDDACQEQLNRIVRIGRAAGVCVVAATQRPSSTMFKKFGDSKAMFSATMCFHVRDEINSRMLLDNEKAALIPNISGRAVYQWDRELEVQTMFLPVKQAREIVRGLDKGVMDFVVEPRKRLPTR